MSSPTIIPPLPQTALTPAALAAAAVALCAPQTVVRRTADTVTGRATLTLRTGSTIEVNRYSWAAGGGLWWSTTAQTQPDMHQVGEFDRNRFTAVAELVGLCEQLAAVTR